MVNYIDFPNIMMTILLFLKTGLEIVLIIALIILVSKAIVYVNKKLL